MRAARLVAVVTALVPWLASCAATPSQRAMTSPPDEGGYLSESRLQDLVGGVSDRPADGSPTARLDVAASDRLRSLEDSDRWLLATRHAQLRPSIAVSHFDCALGTRLASADSPRLVALLDKVFKDANAAAELAKARAFRPRPVAVDPDRRACQVVSAAGRASASHPSGSAAVGAAYGEALALLAPDRAAAVQETGRQIGISRMICAMHYPSDVEAGAALGQAVFAEIAGTPGFAADQAAARAELARARAAGLSNPGCAAERAALASPLP